MAVLTQTVLVVVTGYAVGTLVSAVNLVAPPVLGATLELRQVGSKLLILLGLSAVAPVGSIRRILRIGPVESTVVRGASRCTSDSSSSGDAPDGSPWSASRRRSSSCSAACSTVSPWVPRGHSGPSRPTSSCSSRKRASGPLRSRLTSDAREIVEGVEGVRAVGGLRAVLLVAFVRGGASPTSGSVVVGERDTSGMPCCKLTELRRDDIGFVFQSVNLVPFLTARENRRSSPSSPATAGRRQGSAPTGCSRQVVGNPAPGQTARYRRAVSVLVWIVVSGLAMSALALVGSVSVLMRESLFRRLVMPLVALAAGALLGGAMFHMLPQSLAVLDDALWVFVWAVAGLFSFHVLEQFLHWHHCHRPVSEHEHGPLGYLILVADGLHNLIGGLAVGGAFVVDVQLGIVTWLVAAAHEVPQELGDFGILVHSGWSRTHALLYNVASALTFPLGGLLAYGMAGRVDVAVLVPFAAGNFIYIAVADLLPEITTSPVPREKLVHTATFGAGLALLLGVALLA